MGVFRTLKRISLKNLWHMAMLALKNPLFIWPTFKATQETVNLSYHYYQRKHHENGPANAFRHALWNYLIVKKCTKWSKSKEKVLRWAKNITDWHEHAFPNRELARKMDLHNNEVGRSLFLEHENDDFDDVIEKLLKMTEASVYIKEAAVLKSLKNKLVHIVE